MPFVPSGKTAQTWVLSAITGASDADGFAEAVSIQQINGQSIVPLVTAFQKLKILDLYTTAVQTPDFLIQPLVNSNPQGNSPDANSILVSNQNKPAFAVLNLKNGSNIGFLFYLLGATTAVTKLVAYARVEYQG